MKDHNLLASVALFGELYNNESYNNIFDIIAEFIKGAIVHENKFIVNSQEIKTLLNKVYGFQIPEQVIRTTLNNRFKNLLTRREGNYHFSIEIKNNLEKIDKERQDIISAQNSVIELLYLYIQESREIDLNESDKGEIIENFQHFLLGNGFSDKYSNEINTFLVKNEFSPNFRETLNLIKEGLIIYQGIKYTADLNDLGIWNTNLTIYLNTEHLFNALGYNGLVFEEVFNDFHKLVSEINMASRNRGEGEKINLRYFEETKNEIDRYFRSAEAIKRGSLSTPVMRSAMKKILSETQSPSDVQSLQIRFYSELKLKTIKLEKFSISIASIPEYNVYDDNVLSSLKAESETKSRDFDENACKEYFDLFTRINYFRKGQSRGSFDKVGHIFMTENSFAKYIARHNLVKFEERDIPFAKDIDYITTKLWFKLKKGFSNTHELPRAFDVITKAKMAISSKLNNSISGKYDSLVKDLRDGKLTKEEALERTYVFREKSFAPEEINADNVEETFDFLNNDEYFENIEREKEAQRKRLEEIENENKKLKGELEARKKDDERLEKEKQKERDDLKEAEYVLSEFEKIRKKNWSNFIYQLSIFLFTLAVITFPIIVGISKKLKDWLGEFTFWPIFCIIIWAAAVAAELLCRTYLFDKERVKNGWKWFLIFPVRSKRIKFEFDTKEGLIRDYRESSKKIVP